MDNPDVSQLPTDGPNTPASGRYGTGAEQSRLEAALPRNPQPAGGGLRGRAASRRDCSAPVPYRPEAGVFGPSVGSCDTSGLSI